MSALTPFSPSLIEAIKVLNSGNIRSIALVLLHHRVDQSLTDQWISRLISEHNIQSVEDGKTLAKYQVQIALGSEARLHCGTVKWMTVTRGVGRI